MSLEPNYSSIFLSWIALGAGLVLLTGGGEFLVSGAAKLAQRLGMSSLLIGLTVVAFGTSMPELFVGILALFQKHPDILTGNVIGSNTFNILGCVGLSGLVSDSGLGIAAAVLNFDLWVMIAVAVACLPVFAVGREIGRGRGLLFLAYYVAYVTYLILGARQHDALEEYSAIMMGFVLPITIVTLVAMLIRDQRVRGAGP